MKRLLFGHLLAFWTITAFASEPRIELRNSVEKLTAANCTQVMPKITEKLDTLSVPDYLSEISQGHELVLNDLWKEKIDLHEKLRSLYKSNSLTKDCANAIRGTLRAIRTVEDIVNENYVRNAGSKFPDTAFELGNAQVHRHPEFSNFNLNTDLKSGDIILSKGNAYTSSAISMLGEFDTQFSHMSVVYKDDKGEFWTVEAHIEVGSIVRPLKEGHIADKNFRTMIFRFEDEALAAKAAELMFDKVKNASETTGNILYDFGFDLDENSKLFCSEIASYAYKLASQGKVSLPMFRSRLFERKPEFVKMLEITAAESFIPADIEIDPRFKVVAEWRDANRLNDNMEKDAILQAIFKWNDDYGYTLRQGSSHTSFIYRNIAWPLRHTPYFKKYVIKKLPINMSRKLIGYFGVLESLGKLMQEELAAKDKAAIDSRGVTLLRSEKYEVLDVFRMNDLIGKKKLHKMYRPKK